VEGNNLARNLRNFDTKGSLRGDSGIECSLGFSRELLEFGGLPQTLEIVPRRDIQFSFRPESLNDARTRVLILLEPTSQRGLVVC